MTAPLALLNLVPDLVKDAVNLFDRKFQTDAEKEQAVRDYSTQTADRIQSAWDEEQKNITERHKNDMISDSWLSKNIRPLALVWLLILLTIAMFVKLPEGVLLLLEAVLTLVFTFYFGSRGLEKITNMLAKAKLGGK